MTPRRPAVAFVAWTPVAGRSAEIAAALGGEAHCVYPRRARRGALVPLRYAISALDTARYLARARPRAVIATNPPLLAGIVAWAYAAAARVPVVLDSHPGGFGAQGDRVSERLQIVHKWLARRVAACMVTDEHWVGVLAGWGARGVVVHEAPPLWAAAPPRPPRARPLVLFAGTFGGDEPVEVVLEAARRCPEVDVLVTGDPNRAPRELLADVPPNVTLTGFLGPEAYTDAVDQCDVVLTLSTEPTSVMRAAYEAVYAARPLVLSDWPGLRALFPYATPAANTAEGIASGVRRAVADHDRSRADAGAARDLQLRRWVEQLDALRAALGLPRQEPTTLPSRG